VSHSAEIDAPPVRVCCGQRHYGVTCPDGKIMCCVCFERFDKADLMVEDGTTYDVCRGCAPSVIPPEETQ
jgi:hypothetical protein